MHVLRASNSALRAQSAGAEASDEDDDFEDVDPDELVRRELQRVRAEAKLAGSQKEEDCAADEATQVGPDDDDDDDDDDDMAIYGEPAPLDPATVHRRLLEGVAAWDDSLPEHSDTNEELSAYCPQVTPVHLLQHRGEGGSALLHAVRAGKVGAVAVLVYCGALAKRRRSSVVAANPQTPEYLLHEVARCVGTRSCPVFVLLLPMGRA
eukprot:m.622444 g.622444  ORF g.622444 m.622444 type:complete len:208 (-) comp22543_c0_seq26:1234-1857(-)